MDYNTLLHERLLHTDGLIRESLIERDAEKLKVAILVLEEQTRKLKEDDTYTNFWRKHVARRWSEYSEIQSENQESSDEGFNDNIVSRSASQKHQNQYILRKPTISKENNSIKLGVEKLYKSTPRIDFDDLRSMQMWLSSTIRVFHLVPPQLDNPTLQREVYLLALEKLSPAGQATFLALYEVQSLYMLFDFIRIELENYSEINRHRNPNKGFSILQINQKENQSRDANGKAICPCKNCHQEDHTIKNCPTLKLSFCLKCYK